MNDSEILTTAFGVVALLVTVGGIWVTMTLTTIANNQALEAHRTAQLQQFETTFFNFLQSQRQIISELTITAGQPPHEKTHIGKYYLKYIFEDIFKKAITNAERNIQLQVIGQNERQDELIDQSRNIDRILIYYMVAYNAHNNSLGHYFRSLYHLVRIVHEATVLKDHESKMKYIRLIRAQLSIYENAFIFYNCLSENGKEKFKPLIERYQLLKNLDDTALIVERHKLEYLETAFGKNYKHPVTSIENV